MNSKITFILSIAAILSTTTSAAFISSPLPDLGKYKSELQVLLPDNQNYGVWNMMFRSGVPKWRQSWKGPEKSDEECSVSSEPVGDNQVSQYRYTRYETFKTVGKTNRFSSDCRDVPDKPHSVPEPTLPLLMAIGFLGIPLTQLRKKGDRDSNQRSI